MFVILEDTQQRIELPENSNGIQLAQQLQLTGPDQALGMSLNGQICDLARPLQNGDRVKIFSFEDKLGKEIFWHTSAHVLAQAVLRLYPQAQPTIGPAIEQGFYYDFADLTISDGDFEVIEKEAQKIVKENFRCYRETFTSKEEALKTFGSNPFKKEIIDNLEEGLTGYRQGEFFDLCRGPHLPSIGKIKAFKILKTSGAYWRGDATKPSLTRIYGITFPDKKMLQDYLQQQEEAKKRDHKLLGPKLGLFSLREEAPGLPFIHPKGMIVWNTLLEFWRDCHRRADYLEIKTPSLMTRELWEISGHWANYRQNMYTLSIEERDFAVKPMNCPGCIIYYKMDHHSYREFPLRIAEVGHVHRYEASGALSGLMRVRGFHQDDAHIFMTPEMIEDEVLGVLHLLDEIYSVFGLHYHLELSTRPEKNTIGSDEDWEIATNGLKNALDRTGRSYRVNHGDGAFYGPKIDIHIRDAIGRTWQCGTIQLDMALPQRFELEYSAADGSRPKPIMIHRALFGSIERFFGILIEHFTGKFPLWLSPNQVRILTVADRHNDYAYEVRNKFRKAHFHTDVDDSRESINKKVRTAQLEQINYILTVGDKELESGTVSLRTRDNVVHGDIRINELLEILEKERTTKALHSPFSPQQAEVTPPCHVKPEGSHARDCC
ncbi:MAG: threonyl-tRNA synthetase [Chlamydiales bacterium]|jgi:threonyl-tRNA synthetase|nr:threonyl-tRNA synthetase [Chlamydiales bacterium]